MKVHRYEFEVMWIILAMFGDWVTIHTKTTRMEWTLEPQPARQDQIQEQRYLPFQIRPPPLPDWIVIGFLASE
ncbi:MAG: hypothetical protein JXM79_16015 [Sedimentisphaerales bacterium]|nr:hypothetical protein [Sedimentisphaerales bacterium]